ncbi:AraC family transcriptional regulator [Pseudomonas sp. R5(2019)]|uniref:helix-turn-helix transcriptional regulator n=1 Tax=Pseudomonas sp. R5(2019) TaxID=2697566 RepID=UPI001412447E|nr:AraC family transcriptional regulator [Pseudomonas sp. R5(2019)]NBA97927.1 helix-turn-helix domain-containing protein [Pseudomonas sp. R5(2019)]
MALITEHLRTCGLVESAWVNASAASFPRHTHDDYVLSANLRGVEQIWLDGVSSEVHAGSVTLYNPLAVQGSEFGPQGVEYISLHLDPEAVRRVIVDNHLEGPQDCPTFAQGVLQQPALFQAIVDFASVAPQQLAEQDEAFIALLCQLLERGPGKPGEQTASLQRARDAMHDTLSERLSLEALADIAGMSKYHFVRCFKKDTGLAPLQYQMQLRLIEARRRLRLGQRPLDVAVALGFYDQSHFITAFRKVMGVTPQVYVRGVG